MTPFPLCRRPSPAALQALGLLLIVFGLSTATDSRAAEPTALRIQRAEGGAELRAHPRLPWRGARVGGEVPLGQELRCREGCDLALGAEATISLGVDASVRAEGPRFLRFDGEDYARRVDVVGLKRGDAEVQRSADSGSPTILSLPGEQLLALWSGRIELRALTGRTIVTDVTGRASLRRGRSWTTLEQGTIHEIDASGSVQQRAPVTPAAWNLSSEHHRPIGIATEQPSASVSLSWTAAPGRSDQRLEITSSSGKIVASKTLSPELRHLRLPLREGHYLATIRVADEDGVWSPASVAQPLAVVRLALPSGGTVTDDGTIVIPDDTTLRLLAIDGLEMAIDKHGYVPATREIAMPSADDHWLRLRLAGEPTSQSRFLVERRALEAKITLGPRAPVWPEDVVEAQVRLVDPSGRIDAQSVRPRFRVRVGTEEIPAYFTYNGKRWHGRIPGRKLSRPKLLELTVEDDLGHPIGHAFLEVVANGKRR